MPDISVNRTDRVLPSNNSQFTSGKQKVINKNDLMQVHSTVWEVINDNNKEVNQGKRTRSVCLGGAGIGTGSNFN